MAPRFGLLLGLLGATVVLVAGCVDQTLIPVERPASGGSGGAGNVTSTGGGGTNVGSGGTNVGSGGGNATSGPHNGGSGNGGSTIGSGSGGWFGSGGNGPNGNGGGVGVGGQNGSCSSKFNEACNGQNLCCRSGLLCIDGACCKDLNQFCNSNVECCNGSCFNSSCCKSVNQQCSNDAECCSKDCVDGYCSDVVNQCFVADYSVRCNDGVCCSGKCNFYDGGTTKVCQAIEGCKPVGERCLKWFECCSDYCDSKTSRCLYKDLPFCQKSGDTCGEDTAGHQQCCSNLTCVLGSEGVRRCQWNEQFEPCRPFGSPCRVATDCCPIGKEATGHCLSRNDAPPEFYLLGNYGTCGICGDAGVSCKVDLDCCAGFTCEGKAMGAGICEPAATATSSKSGTP